MMAKKSLVIITFLLITAGSLKSQVTDTLTDARDGQTYQTIVIGTQTWMAGNLNFNCSNSWCYNNDSASCAAYGRLYIWDAAKNACPAGWHLPSDAEWKILTDYLGGELIAGGKLKSISGWSIPNTEAKNSSGFTGLPGGSRNSGRTFQDAGDYGYWWSATANDATSAWIRWREVHGGEINRNDDYKENGFSVRCISN
jgi:uncharacterized protein (TIGR02145 family)